MYICYLMLVAVLGVKVSRVHLLQRKTKHKCDKGVCAFVILCW